jgi:hypothetical protein
MVKQISYSVSFFFVVGYVQIFFIPADLSLGNDIVHM